MYIAIQSLRNWSFKGAKIFRITTAIFTNSTNTSAKVVLWNSTFFTALFTGAIRFRSCSILIQNCRSLIKFLVAIACVKICDSCSKIFKKYKTIRNYYIIL